MLDFNTKDKVRKDVATGRATYLMLRNGVHFFQRSNARHVLDNSQVSRKVSFCVEDATELSVGIV